MNIDIQPLTAKKSLFEDESKLGFGNLFTDRMFLMDYDAGEGWHSPRIVPYGPLSLDPSCAVLHCAPGNRTSSPSGAGNA